MTTTMTPLGTRRSSAPVCAVCDEPIGGRPVRAKATGKRYCHDLAGCHERAGRRNAGLRVGDPVLVTTIARDIPAVVTGFRAGLPGEAVRRVDVRTTDGRRFHGCHPSCVRPNPPVVA